MPEGVSFEGATLSLKSQTTLSLYFTSDRDVTLTCKGRQAETEHNGKEYVIRIRNIASSELGDSFTAAINGTDAVTYSPLVYCYQAQQTSGDSKLINTVRALYLYWQAADDYFN